MLKRWWPALTGLALFCLLVAGRWYVEAVNQGHPAPWPMVGGGSGQRYYTPASFPDKPDVLWSVPVPEDASTSPLIGRDGTVYVNGGQEVVAFDGDGNRRWAWRSPATLWDMALSRHGLLYAVDREYIYALDEQGRFQWRAQLPGPPLSPILVGQGGSIYYAGGDRVHALADDGSPKWSRQVGTAVAGPVETRSGLIVVATSEELTALRSDGGVEWSRHLGEPLSGRPLAAGADGSIYLRTRTSLIILNEKGQITAEEPMAALSANLAIGDGVVQEGLARRGSEGGLLWTGQHAMSVAAARVIALLDGKGQALIMESGWLIFPHSRRVMVGFTYQLLDPEGRQVWVLSDPSPVSEPAIDSRGNLCFIGRTLEKGESYLYCIGERKDAER